MFRSLRISPFVFPVTLLLCSTPYQARAAENTGSQHPVLTGQAAFTDALHQSPGTRRHLTAADLPAPAPDQSVDNGPTVVARPANAWPIAPKGDGEKVGRIVGGRPGSTPIEPLTRPV